MRRGLLWSLATIVSLAAWADDGEQAKRTKEQAALDAKLLATLQETYQAAFGEITGGVTVHETSLEGTLAKCQESYDKILAVEAEAVPKLQPDLARIFEAWAKPPTEEQLAEAGFDWSQHVLQQSSDVEWNMKMAAANNDVAAARDLPEEFDNIGTAFSRLSTMVRNVGQTRQANGEYLANQVQTLYSPDMIKFYVEGIRVDKMKEAKRCLEWALKFDPNNKYATDRMATIDADIAALAKAVEADIDARKWAGNADGAPAHGQAALEFLRNHENWGRHENGTAVLAVAVRGDWVPGERDFLGRIISWGLPIQVAVTRPDIKAQNRARVYELTLITRQGAPSPARKPPFVNYWVGESWFIRPTALPKP